MSDDLDFMPADDSGEPAVDASAADTSAAGDEADRAPGERAELPTWNRSRRKRKANVKAEQEDDGFKRSVRKASRQVIDTPRLVIGAIAIGVLVIGGGVALMNHRTTANAEASRKLQQATLAINRGEIMTEEEFARVEQNLRLERLPIFTSQEDLDAAITTAIEASRVAGRKDVELDTLLVAAAQAVQKGDFDAALADYESFLTGADTHHPLRFLALEGKGIVLEAKEDLAGALAAFEAIAPNSADHYRDMALYHRGRVLEGLERKDEAIELYQQFLVEFPKERAATPLVRARFEALDPELAATLSAPEPAIQMPPMP